MEGQTTGQVSGGRNNWTLSGDLAGAARARLLAEGEAVATAGFKDWGSIEVGTRGGVALEGTADASGRAHVGLEGIGLEINAGAGLAARTGGEVRVKLESEALGGAGAEQIASESGSPEAGFIGVPGWGTSHEATESEVHFPSESDWTTAPPFWAEQFGLGGAYEGRE
jgi:hypothetical protein